MNEEQIDRYCDSIVESVRKYVESELDPIKQRLREREDELTERRQQMRQMSDDLVQLRHKIHVVEAELDACIKSIRRT